MARKPTLSPSKLSTYIACPVKYRWTYLDARGRFYLTAKKHYSFGMTLHKVLEQFHSEDREGVPTTDEVLASYEDNWIDAGFSNPEEMAEAFSEGKAILENYIAAEAVRLPGVKTLFTEKALKHEYENFLLLGRLDRVDEHPDGTLEIIDYKSGRSEVTEADVYGEIAMGIYQLLLSKSYPDRAICSTLIAIRTGAKATVSLTADELAALEGDIIVLADEILSHDYYELEPRLKSLCNNCDFIRLCGKHPDFAEALEDRNNSQDQLV